MPPVGSKGLDYIRNRGGYLVRPGITLEQAVTCGSQNILLLRTGIIRLPLSFSTHVRVHIRQERPMVRVQSVEEARGVDPRPSEVDAKPSFKRASILFVASFGSLIGTSLLLASIGQ
jgi:hypothetical protein